jgi:hypothetical protein
MIVLGKIQEVCITALYNLEYFRQKLHAESMHGLFVSEATNPLMGAPCITAALLVLSSTLTVTEPYNPRYQGLALSLDKA